MNLNKLCKTAPLALVIAAGAFAATAQAEPYYADDGVTVVSPYIVKKQRDTSSVTGGQRITVSRVVSTRDLDLRRGDDVYRLNREVEYAASDVCRQIDLVEPAAYFTASEQRECYRDALRGAQRQVNRAVARANYRY